MGGLVNDYQSYKLYSLVQLLNSYKPKKILELGSGTTTAVFADYVKSNDGVSLVSVDESTDWINKSSNLSGISGDDARFKMMSAPKIVEELEDEAPLYAGKGLSFQILLIIVGLVLLIGGAKFLVAGGVGIARNLGISEWFIGITIVAVGTSLPEIVSSIIAAKRGHGEMAIGNIFGSNIFNILMVLGLTATIHPLNINEPIQPDLLITIAITGLLLAMIRYGNHSLGRLKGGVLILVYCIYIGLKGTGNL